MTKKDYKYMYEKMSNDEISYIESRLDDQISWYDCKSISSQKQYKRFKTIIIISSASIPLVVSYSNNSFYFKLISSLLGVLITVLEGVSSINKYQEHWIEYRSICETLKQEKYMYVYRSGLYEENCDRLKLLVERIESIISRENTNWAVLNRCKGGDNDG